MASYDAPITNAGQLFDLFRDSEKPANRRRIGAEMEKFGVRRADGAPVTYGGKPIGVETFLQGFVSQFGYVAESEVPGGPMIALAREDKNGVRASVTLEPGGQLELSGGAHISLFSVRDEFDEHMRELQQLSAGHDVAWLGLGFQPFAKRGDYTFVPKLRYAVMKEYLPTKGSYGLDMMLRTSTVQANFDYASEAEAMEMLRLSMRLAPLTAALFANSPFYEGQGGECLSYRARVWLSVDPDRSGMVPPMWQPNAGYEQYVDWVLDAPMFMFKRDGASIDNRGQSFRAFLKDGFAGHQATLADWEGHVNTMFPEVRLKRTLEVRGADAQHDGMAIALPAFWTGLLYDEQARGEALERTAMLKLEHVEAARARVPFEGPRALLAGRSIIDWAREIVPIAAAGLARRAKNTGLADEQELLAPLQEHVARGTCPADSLRDRLGAQPSVRDVIAAAEIKLV